VASRAWHRALAPGDYIYRVEARQGVSGHNARGLGTLEVPLYPAGQLQMSDILVARHLGLKSAGVKPQSRGDLLILPSGDLTFHPGDTVYIYWETYGLQHDSTGNARARVDLALRVDVSDPAAVDRGFAELRERWGELDVVVNGAGISGRSLGDGPVDACTEEAWDAVLEANLKSVFLCSKHAIPALRSSGGGAIVNLASVLGLVGSEDFATHAYAASKGGIVALTRAMAVTYAPEGIRCNVVCPALVDTPMSERARSDPRIRERLRELQPLTGEPGRPEDVAGAAVYLASAPFVTGAVLTVDGGWTAR
jgi:NAD(P)-dependent dehydrogenase (short-subunit alcohol dehydrogenase family)